MLFSFSLHRRLFRNYNSFFFYHKKKLAQKNFAVKRKKQDVQQKKIPILKKNQQTASADLAAEIKVERSFFFFV